MQTIETLLQEDDPIEMVINEILGQHPELGALPPGSFSVSKIKPAVGDRNTEAIIIGTSATGIKGKMSIFYDRADLGRVFNQYGDVTVNPEIFINADVGASVAVNDVIQQINAALKLKMLATGNWLDVQPFTFTAAAKGGKTTIALTGKAGSADGSPPVSARVLPGKQLKIDVVNRGSHINKKMLSRSINPFVKSTGHLNWNGESILVSNPIRSLSLALYNTDFSDIFNTMPLDQILTYVAYTNGAYIWRFNRTIVTAIKDRCVALGLPIIDFTNAQQSGKQNGQGAMLLVQMFRDTSLYSAATFVNKAKFARMVATSDSFLGISSPTGSIANVKPTIEAKLGWAIDAPNYPLYFNLA